MWVMTEYNQYFTAAELQNPHAEDGEEIMQLLYQLGIDFEEGNIGKVRESDEEFPPVLKFYDDLAEEWRAEIGYDSIFSYLSELGDRLSGGNTI
jgi:hypothetical protein